MKDRLEKLIDATNAACASSVAEFVNGSRDVAYFVGSGLSRPFYPSWPELASRMYDFFDDRGCNLPGEAFPSKAEVEGFVSRDLQGLFQRFRDTEARLYIECIRDIFNIPPMRHNGSVMKILRKTPPLITTLNFDIGIEATAHECGIEISPRYFPDMRYLSQERENVPVVMHLHGMFHDRLFEYPDEIILHAASYRRYYEEGNREILSMFAEIFLRWDVVFVGTALSEPEMEFFFAALRKYQAEDQFKKGRIALLHTTAAPETGDIDACEAVLGDECSKDVSDQERTGIQRVRFFRKDDEYRGLDEILAAAFGQNVAVPRPRTIW